MNGVLDTALPMVFAIAAILYISLAAMVSRSSAGTIMGFFLMLLGVFVAGAAFTYNATNPTFYGIGRSLSFFAAGFIPVAFYAIYRQYTAAAAKPLTILALSIIPVATTLLALTNSMHEMIWTVTDTSSGPKFSTVTTHWWFTLIHAPFAYGLFGLSLLALAARISGFAPAHRMKVVALLICAVLPFAGSILNTFLGVGSIEFPVLATSLVLLLPLYAYISLTLRVFEFSPLDYPMVFDHVRDPIFVLDKEQRIVCVNRRATELLGGTERELLGRHLWEDFPEAQKVLREAQELDLTQTLTMTPEATYEVSVAPLQDSRGNALGSVVVCRDVTERRKTLTKLAESEHQIRTLIETSSNGILRFARDRDDPNGRFRCVFANRAAEGYLRGGRGSLVGAQIETLTQLNPDRLVAHFDQPEPPTLPVNFEVAGASGEDETWFRIVGEAVGDDFSVTLVDITQRKRNENQMLADALHDPLTGILNRRGFEKAARDAIQHHQTGAVLYLDLNQFKSINDRFGHHVGDALLKAFGHRLEYCLRPQDVLGRLGGDEFSIVLPGGTVDDAKHVAERLMRAASDAYVIQGEQITCSASVGIALMPRHGEELWHLISVADQAMYNAKSIGAEEAANDRAAYVEAAVAS